MRAKFDMDEGRQRFKTLIAEMPEDKARWNEAQNRFKFIDQLLMECLGWDRSLVDVEQSDVSGGKSDYVLGKPVKAVLEAKRESRCFEFLAGTRVDKIRKIGPLLDACSVLKDCVLQVTQYCSLHGAQLAIVCNGPQLVIFQAITPGVALPNGYCYVFDGLDSYENNFPLLWNMLSPEGVEENRAQREFSNRINPRIPAKALTAIGEPTAYRYRSSFQENLRTLASILLDNIDDNPTVKGDFYRECYVPIEANNRHLLLSKKMISARYKRVSDNGIQPASLGASVKKGRVELEDGSGAEGVGRKPIVVIGDVGVGKTSFFENLFHKIDQEDKKKTLYVHINLGNNATLSSDLRSYVVQSLFDTLKNEYELDIESSDFVEGLYEEDLRGFDLGVSGKLKDVDSTSYLKERIKFLSDKVSQKGEHLKKSIRYISGTMNKQFMVVVDNADQRSFDTQQKAFLISQEIASIGQVIVFVALRPSTFYQSKLTGALSGYQNRVLTISPPPADEVLRKRIAFAVRVAEGKTAPAALDGVRLSANSIVIFLQSTLRSIRSNDKIKNFLGNITGGNTRLVIELISSFCGSPNVDSERIVKIEEETGNYTVPLHEFTKHALLGEYSYFNQLSSIVGCNIYDVSSADYREHFLASLIVAYLNSPMGIRDNDGFVSGYDIVKQFMSHGFSDAQIRFWMRRLASRRLIETPHGHYRELQVDDTILPDTFHFRVTSIGLYHVRYWAGEFAFLDATSIDTPIFDEEIRAEVSRLADSFDINDRYHKSLKFKSYLEAKWHQANFDLNYFDLPTVFSGQAQSFEKVEIHLGIREKPRRRYQVR